MIKCSGPNGLIELNESQIIVSVDKELIIINLVSKTIEQNSVKDEYALTVIAMIQLQNGNILCGNSNSILIYDIKNNVMFMKYTGENLKGLLSINDNQFLSYSGNGVMELWEY